MAGIIRASDIEEVKSRINIADVVSDYVSLKPASVGSLKGLCPFHDEKSPSFNVRPAQGFYHCFGCGEGGDVYKFVQRIENLGFTESVERLAERIGFQLTYQEGSGESQTGVRARILEANEAAASYFQEQLNTEGAAAGRQFLTGRGFDTAAAELFGLGFAPKGWSGLTDHLKAKGFSIDELVTAGLAAKSDKGGYDKFRGRLIWPIRDSGGSVIGFGARKLFDDDTGPKYLNTSDTPVYHKSQVLYGIDLARKDMAKGQQVVVVEGYTDVMACHLAGVTTAVATCGTAFGDEHIRVINRIIGSSGKAAQVIFTFDPDAAGQKAAMRAFEDSSKFEAQVFVAVGPDGLDPCDLRSERGDEAVQAMLVSKKPIFEFAIRQKLANFDLNSLEGRVLAVRSAASVIAAIRDQALRPAYIRELAGWVNLPTEEVALVVQESIKNQRASDVAHLRTDAPKEQETDAAVAQFEPVNLRDPMILLERQILEVLVQVPSAFNQGQLQRIAKAGMRASAHQALLEQLPVALTVDAPNWLARIQRAIPENLEQLLREVAAKPLPASTPEHVAAYAKGVVAGALDRAIASQRAELLAELKRTEAATSRFDEIQVELVQLEAERRALKG